MHSSAPSFRPAPTPICGFGPFRCASLWELPFPQWRATPGRDAMKYRWQLGEKVRRQLTLRSKIGVIDKRDAKKVSHTIHSRLGFAFVDGGARKVCLLALLVVLKMRLLLFSQLVNGDPFTSLVLVSPEHPTILRPSSDGNRCSRR